MKGTYEVNGCRVIDPTVTVLVLNKDYPNEVTIVTVNIYGKNDGETPELMDGAQVEISDEGNPLPATTTEQAVKGWAEDYLQQYKQ